MAVAARLRGLWVEEVGEETVVSGQAGLEAPVEGLGLGVTRLHVLWAALLRRPLPPPRQSALP